MKQWHRKVSFQPVCKVNFSSPSRKYSTDTAPSRSPNHTSDSRLSISSTKVSWTDQGRELTPALFPLSSLEMRFGLAERSSAG